MDIFQQAILWLGDPENWVGSGSIPNRTLEHLSYTAVAVAIAAAIAVPLGYYIGHTGRGRVLAVGTAGAARALPTFGLMLYLVLVFGVSERATAATVSLVLLAIPPLLAGAYAGVDQINRSTIDAAKAQGMTDWQILTRVEIPLSLPLLIGGLRGATLQVVATVTLIAYVGLGGLGYEIIQGIPLRRLDQMVGAALLIIVLALVIDGLLALLTRLATPQGVTTGRGVDVRARQKTR
ncbi:osmoprotectant ABC permease [Pontimonas salivibrio]|jgi:osmoprotectant transport system permease protein|uniref:Osmoprotectant ABC permease n=1 Tax=Pontimonas salivibrio TaxID=1159327 RepID=A0A2L2BQ11_9MICO|nr:ABC transporter permease [Pontimonas salivibrio]AVG23763.1 osmoprotectant ABC permease [Pontimonas salivibrio]